MSPVRVVAVARRTLVLPLQSRHIGGDPSVTTTHNIVAFEPQSHQGKFASSTSSSIYPSSV
ncbi:hypothetical protein [Dendronalium sp. ChiSLP03b]|uniref:hypothetical protein n=1 Tax=Dendronalium sp. ChiSLP03b TaxID=3075381 RepID=UPI002AD5836F|nr:hypothetical protein [Dendronalium sp. ChiSLP03b]MDZ8203097.1 hypothetical protein [Dendronalium sp. ChiSLP03b]